MSNQSAKLILGTVQFGLDYGVNNRTGKPARQQALAILERAWELGIRTLDTAEAYGDAMEVIGEYHRLNLNQPFKVISKFKGLETNGDAAIQQQLDRVQTDQLEALLYHRASEFLGETNHLESLQDWKNKGWLRSIGVSIYTNEEGLNCLQTGAIDLIQLPFNILDNLTQRASVLEEAAKQGVAIHTRSVFLQGLFFMNPEQLPEKLLPLKPALEAMHQTIREQQVDSVSAILQYALQQPLIQQVLIGVDSIAQLEANLKAVSNVHPHIREIVARFDTLKTDDPALLNPANWNT